MLEVRGVSFQYGETPVLQDINLSVGQGEIIAILGASGSGKSTLLRLIAGLEPIQSGVITWDDQSVHTIPVHRRDFGLMFQDYALFPHLNVIDNVMFGLRMKGLRRAEAQERAHDMLRRVRMDSFSRRAISDLSGGEKQRVALARSLVGHPRLLMLDEPFGALDAALRRDLIEEVRAILAGEGISVLYVTHDQAEAFAIADRVALMRGGAFIQLAAPIDLVEHPADPYVVRFLGMGNLLPVTERQGNHTRLSIGSFPVQAGDEYLFVHPWAITLSDQGIPVVVQSVAAEGLVTRMTVRLPEGHDLEFAASSSAGAHLRSGQQVQIQVDAARVVGMADAVTR